MYVSSKLPGETVWESFPSFVQKILENAGLNSDNIFKLSDTATLSEMVNSTISAVEEILLPLLSLILLILFFVIISVLLGIVIKLIDKFFKLPVLNSLNKFLGMLVGFIFGILIVYVLCTYISDMIMLIPNEFSNVFSQLAETSKIKEFLAGLALK